MKKTKKTKLNIQLTGDEIDTFNSIISKVQKESEKAGFKRSQFDEDEQKLLDKLNEEDEPTN